VHSVEEVRAFCRKYGKKPLILDTNLLLLLLVGICDTAHLCECKSTSKYSNEDYRLLRIIFGFFQNKIFITPHILAELSNLSKRDVPGHRLHYYFTAVADKLRHFGEHHVPMSQLATMDVKLLSFLGFSDVGIVEAAVREKTAIITADYDLYAHATGKGVPCVYFETTRTNKYLPAEA